MRRIFRIPKRSGSGGLTPCSNWWTEAARKQLIKTYSKGMQQRVGLARR